MTEALDRPLRVLIADDEAVIRALVQAALVGCDVDLSVACDGLEALDAIRTTIPDVALLDVRMPGIDGLQLCRAVRGERALAETRLVLLTATASESEGLGAGADAFMAKPFRPSELRDLVQALGRRSVQARG